MFQNHDKYYCIASLVSANDLIVEELWNEFLPFHYLAVYKIMKTLITYYHNVHICEL